MPARQIYFAAPKHAYNNRQRGYGYEYNTLFKCLKSVAPSAEFVDVYSENGVATLLRKVDTSPAGNRPLIIYVPFLGVLGPSHLRQLSSKAEIGVFFLDDTWRNDLVALYFQYCDWFTTSDPNHQWRYKNKWATKAKYVPFGYDADLATHYHVPFEQRDIEMSFIGAKNDFRAFVINRLQRNGIDVSCFGEGWPNGKVTQDEYYGIIGRSRTSLNLSNSAQWDVRFLSRHPISLLRNIKTAKKIEQFKARHIEISALGVCQLSFYSFGIERIFTPGHDILIYPNVDELIYIVEQVTDEEKATIAENGRVAVQNLSYQTQFKSMI